MTDHKMNTNVDFDGRELKSPVIHKQHTADAPQYVGQLSFDSQANMMRYSPDGAAWTYLAANGAGAAYVGAPAVEISGRSSGWTTGADGYALGTGRGSGKLYARDVPAAFFTDKLLDAGIDLMVFRQKAHNNGRMGQAQFKRHTWTHPVSVVGGVSEDQERVNNGIIPKLSMYRGAISNNGNGPVHDRRTFWPLFGRQDGDEIEKDVNFAAFFRKCQVEVFEKPNVPSSVQFNGAAVGPAGTNRTALGHLNPRKLYNVWGAGGLAMYFGFAYSWRDLSHPDKRARIVGPISQIIRVSCYPWPVQIDSNTGILRAVDAKSLAVKFDR